MLPVNVSAFLEAFGRWARAQPDIEAVALVGSYARNAAIESSDVDLVILTSGVDRYLRDRSWVSLFGEAQNAGKRIMAGSHLCASFMAAG
jgi:predicted nucleotidyltransferase